MKKNLLEAIFFDEHHHWDRFVEKYGRRIRPVVKKEVKKFRNCRDIRKGYRLLVCEGCHDVKIIPLSCKGKFCPSCSIGESQKWAETTANDLFRVVHRHVIFTIDEGLREIFLIEEYRKELLKGLMDEAAQIIMNFFKRSGIQPGIIATLHTFGSKLEFNPHVHMVVTMGGVTKKGRWETYDYLPYTMLRKYWQNAVLKLIRRTLSDWHKKRVQPALQRAYTKNGEGFYVNAPKRSHTDSRPLLEYISRYMKRGPIALKNLVMYDGEQVMFHYKDKRTNTKETMTMSVEAFIRALIRHIPDKHFKTIRRYGIYSSRLKKMTKTVVEDFQKIVKQLLVNAKRMLKPKTWSERIIEEFGVNPLECTECGESYECLGMSVRKNGHLHIQYAKNEEAKQCMREENQKIEKEAFQTAYQEAEKAAYEAIRFDWDKQGEIYLSQMS